MSSPENCGTQVDTNRIGTHESAAEHVCARPAHENKTPERIHRLLLISSHPVPYAAPLYRLMTRQAELEIQVAYCGVGPTRDSEFGRNLDWNVPLLDGYHWVRKRNWLLRPGLGRFFGLINPGIWLLISQRKLMRFRCLERISDYLFGCVVNFPTTYITLCDSVSLL
jgi:hypothetical protein